MNANVDLSSLRMFLTVCEEGTLAGAAEKLFLSQPAVSVRIRNLEDQLGLQLLVRSRRGVRPTHAGNLLRESLADIVGRIEAAVGEAQMAARHVTHRITFWSPPSLLAHFVPSILDCLGRLHPGVEVAMNSELRPLSDVMALMNGDLDCAILVDSHPPLTTHRAVDFLRDPVGLTLAPDHPLARQAHVAPEDLAGSRFMAYDAHFWQIVKNAFAQTPLHLDAALSIRDSTVLKDLVAKQYGLTFQPLTAAMKDVQDGQLAFRPVDLGEGRLLEMGYWFCYAKNHPLAAILGDVERAIRQRATTLEAALQRTLGLSPIHFQAAPAMMSSAAMTARRRSNA